MIPQPVAQTRLASVISPLPQNTIQQYFVLPKDQFPDMTDNYQQTVVIPAEKAQEAANAAEAQRQADLQAQQVTAVTQPQDGSNSYAYGNCTYFVKQHKPEVPNYLGNARNWGYILGSSPTPQPGTVAWTTAGYYGHVAIVEQVSGSQVQVAEMNVAGWNVVDYSWYPVSYFRYIYI